MFIKLIRVGRDAEIKYLPSGKAVCNVACAYDVGWGENKRTGWIDGVLWEKRAESLAPYLVKGQQAHVTFDDVELEKWDGGSKIKGRIVDIQLCGGNSSQEKAARKPAPKPKPVPQDDFQDDSDIPF